ncbi:MAG: hypothetical protein U0736_10310 [Gemmataceae bacterium]
MLSANTLDATTFPGTVVLDGGPGNDVLRGGRGNDLLTGGPGNDVLIGNGGIDTVVEAADTNMTLTNSHLYGGGVLGWTYWLGWSGKPDGRLQCQRAQRFRLHPRSGDARWRAG